MKKQIEVSAPGKLMLFGEHAVVYGRPCIVTAVDQRVRVGIEQTESNFLELNAPDVGIERYRRNIKGLGVSENLSKGARFVEIAVKNFFQQLNVSSGIRIGTSSDFSSEFGFGSSSAVTVAVIKGLSEVFKKNLSKREIFDLSYQTVLEVQKVGSGFDIAAAVWGGTIYFVKGGKVIKPVKNIPSVVGYTGVKADTTSLVLMVSELYKKQKVLIGGIFEMIGKTVEQARRSLLVGDSRKLGELMNINQGLLDSLGVNTPELSNLIFAARGAGAYGAKLSGAGGGDCMIAFVSEDSRKNVEKAIKEAGGKVLRVKTGAEGIKIEK